MTALILTVAALGSCSSGKNPISSVETTRPSAVSSPPSTLPATESASVVPPEVVSVTPLSVPAAAPVRLQVPMVGLDVEVRELPRENSNPINPPTMMDAYWDPDFGLPGTDASDITVIAAHSWTRGDAAFNPLLTLVTDNLNGALGAEVHVTTASGELTYVVVEAAAIPKPQLSEANFWEVVDGCVVVLITCYWDTPSNMVLIARRPECS